MSYHTPAGFAERCLMRRTDLAHQIRIVQLGSTTFVSCVCLLRRTGPGRTIAEFTDVDQAWRQWHDWHSRRPSPSWEMLAPDARGKT